MKYYRKRRYSQRKRRESNYNNNSKQAFTAFISILLAFAAILLLALLSKVIVFLKENVWLLIVLIISASAAATIFISNYIITKKYTKIATEQCIAICKLRDINSKYIFKEFDCPTFEFTYDNEIFYDEVSPLDYLIYQLVYMKNDAINNAKAADENRTLYQEYMRDVSEAKSLQNCDITPAVIFKRKLKSIEKILFDSMIQNPVRDYQISVILTLTNINGAYRSEKTKTFNYSEISDVIVRLNNKKGDRYLDENIWQSICRVERGKVSNKMRFAIYKRDGYRCKKCGKATDDLEIDHIFPIAKGGKSNFENLQTLCHRCNALKSDTVEANAIYPRAKYNGINENCPICGAPLTLKKGKYGSFYGCFNYPKCTFTKKT